MACRAALGTLALMAAARPLAAQDAPAGPKADDAAIRAAAQEYIKAFNAGDAKALAAIYTADAEYVDDLGRAFQGRTAIEKHFKAGFVEQPGATLDISVSTVRMLSPDVALESGSSRVKTAAGRPGPLVKYSAVQVRRDGKWLISNVTESRFAPQSNELYLKDLAWLVGSWQSGGKKDERQVNIDCQWLPGKSFLSRSFTVTEAGATTSSGLQIIGWDPTLQQIVSWTFNSDGSNGHEFWTPDGSRWTIEASSTLPNGQTSLARNLLTRLNNNTFTWRSVDRSLNDQLLPDTAEVRVKRIETQSKK